MHAHMPGVPGLLCLSLGPLMRAPPLPASWYFTLLPLALLPLLVTCMWRAAVLDRVFLLDKRTLWVAVLNLLPA